MKLIIVAITMLMSFNISAAWKLNQYGVSVVGADNSNAFMAMYIENNDEYLYITYPDYHCYKSTFKKRDITKMVNGQGVKFTELCDDDNRMQSFPTNTAGYNFLVEQLYNKSIVKIDGINFSAVGFRQQVQHQIDVNKNVL
ncbi:hypothetical protein [Aeromonas veronii]|uniref:hypothetical protein n=1 Tax=Aeromonas veronii TaxID=654 RepID=UPI003BF56D68